MIQSLVLCVSFLGFAYTLLQFNALALITAYSGIILFFVIKAFRKGPTSKGLELTTVLAAFSITALFMSFIYNSETMVSSYTWLFMLFFMGFVIITYTAVTIKKQHVLKAAYYNVLYSIPILAISSVLLDKVSETVMQYVLPLSYVTYVTLLYLHVKKALKTKRLAKLTFLTHKLDVNDKSMKKLSKALRLFDPVKYSSAKPMLNSEHFSANYVNKSRVGSNNMTIFLMSNNFTEILKTNPEILYSFNGRYFKGPHYNPIKLLFDIPFKIFGRYSSLIVVDEPNNIKQPFVVTLGEDKYYVTSINKINDTLKTVNKQNTRFRSFSKRNKHGKTIQN